MTKAILRLREAKPDEPHTEDGILCHRDKLSAVWVHCVIEVAKDVVQALLRLRRPGMQKSLTERATPRSPSLGARDATRRRHPPSRWPLVTAFTVIIWPTSLASLLSLGAIDFGIVGDSNVGRIRLVETVG
jgi:hypothetical protein